MELISALLCRPQPPLAGQDAATPAVEEGPPQQLLPAPGVHLLKEFG
jgi:hypothetical protein